jgi:rod shape-determining protein MreD
MKVKVLFYALTILIIILIQSTILEYLNIFGIKPNIIITLVICIALLNGSIEGACVGFAAGLLQDILFGYSIGFYALLGMFLGYAAGSSNKGLYKENFVVVVLFTFIWSFVYEFAVYFFGYIGDIFLRNIGLLYPIRRIIIPEAVYNSVISIPVYLLTVKITNRFENVNDY